MGLMPSYLITTKNLEPFFNSLVTAQAPTTFTLKFLESLEFKSTNDRLYIGILKGLGFLDANSAPTERYYKFLDQSQSKKILAEAIREAYSDLFAINIKANELSDSDIKNKFRTLTQGKSSANVLKLMANTFKALVNYAEWGIPDTGGKDKAGKDIEQQQPKPITGTAGKEEKSKEISDKNLQKAELHYNIQIHLPESRDPAVYDALFKSLKEHLF
jgi:hypothetical protein